MTASRRLPRFGLKTLMVMVAVAAIAASIGRFVWQLYTPLAKPSEPILALWEEPILANVIVGPYLRFAIWDDGRCVHASDQADSASPLVEYKLTKKDLELLKTQLSSSGVTRLTRRSYLVSDAPIIRLFAVVGGRKYMLQWDEYLHPNYGISRDFGDNEKAFVKCWNGLRAIAQQRAHGTTLSQFNVKETASWR